MATIEDFKTKASAPATQDKPTNFPAMLKQFQPEIERALPRHMSGDRMARIALTCFRQNPKLAECDPRSVFACVIQSAQLGLELGMRGHAFLVPYKRNFKVGNEWRNVMECQFIPGWIGLVDLVSRAGRASVWTGAVFEGDEFEYQLGDMPFVKHKPMGEDDETKLTHVYAVGRVKGAEYPVLEVWPITKILKHRNRFNKVGDKHYSYENLEMYARKIPLLQVLKYIPSSPELNAAIALNDAAEIGNQGLTVEEASNGSWAPPNQEQAEDVPYTEKTAPAPASQAPEAQKDKVPPPKQKTAVTFAQVVDRLVKAKDIDVLKADAELIDQLPPELQEEAREKYIECLDLLGRQ